MGDPVKRPDSFEKLLKEGSERSRAQDAKQASGGLALWLVISLLVSLVFPLFWLVFAALLLAALVYGAREWMG
jgi:dolichol kinase